MDGELDQLGERIAELAAHLDAAMHRLLTDLRDFDQRGGWHLQGTMSCAHWLSWRVGWTLGTARDRVRVAGKLGELPTIDDALRRGEVSYSKVRAITRVATPANETMLLELARLMTASHLEKTCRKYALVQRHGQESKPWDDEQRRYVRRRDTEDGMVKIEAVLHPEEAEMVWAMLNRAATAILRGCADSTPVPADARAGHVCQADGSADAGTAPGGQLCQADASAEMADALGGHVCQADGSAETADAQGGHVCRAEASAETADAQGGQVCQADASAETADALGGHVCQADDSAETGTAQAGRICRADASAETADALGGKVCQVDDSAETGTAEAGPRCQADASAETADALGGKVCQDDDSS
jgi:hypothetical protein